tara:strand:+ start:774 stop:2108 length:1335 start_codon:yes stop_codon:yes gene_type:complete
MGLLDNVTHKEYYQGNDHGSYQFTSLKNIIEQFVVAYVGENKIIPKVSKLDVAFHAQRALQELSFDTFKSIKAQEIAIPASLQMTLPQDYVNYTKISWVDSAGIKHLLYPTSKTSNPNSKPLQDNNGDFILQAIGTLSSISENIVLTAEHKDIIVGMVVTGPYIPINTFVGATENSSSITTITLQDSSGTIVLPTQSNAGTTLTFTKTDGSLILPQKSSYIVENLSWDTISADYKITGTAADLVNLEIGMLVSHDNFPIGTVITNVFDTTIVVSNLPDNTVTSAGEVTFISPDKVDTGTWSSYKSGTPSENQDDYQDDTYWPMDGSRYGLDPQHAQANGSFYIDDISGKIHFSSNISGKTVILDYISDGLGTDGEMQVHKFAEEAMYKWIAHAIISTSSYGQQLVPRFKKEKFAAVRQAKLRLSNIKLEELTQVLRGKSKQIKH